VAALALLSFSLTAPAQAAPPAAPLPAGSDLSPAQQARIRARQEQFQKDLAALRADAKMTNAQKQAKYTAMVQAADKDTLAMLTPVQRAGEMKRRQINAQFRKDVAALSANKSLTDAQKRARYVALVQAADAQTFATLTPAQRALVQKRRQAGLDRQAEVKRLAQELQKSETPAQESQIHEIGLKAGAQVQAVIADKSLDPTRKTAKIKDLEQQAQ
jgi:hypothetical protein